MNATVTNPETAINLPPHDLGDSPFQKSRVSDRGKIDELADSMKSVGVLEPLLARLVKGKYELVAGHRRKRGAIKAGLETVPVIVREYTDDQVLEIQMVENSQREDVHPLDEADNFEAMLKRGRTAVEIADKIGRPYAYVVQRLQLCELGADARKALDEERITLSLAHLIARIPDKKLQAQAVEDLAGDEDRSPVTAREGSEIIRDRFMLRLVDAPFDRESATLVKKAGACTTCPKRTGSQAELFADVDSPDLCTDPGCYRSKVDAHGEGVLAAAKKAGGQVLDEAKAKKLFTRYGEATAHGSSLVSVEETKYVDGRGVKVRDAIKGKDVPVTLARNPHTGKIHELVPASVVDKAVKKKASDTRKKGGAKVDEKEKAKERAEAAVAGAIVAKIDQGARGATATALRFLIGLQADMVMSHVEARVAARRGVKPNSKAIEAWAEKADVHELLGTLTDLALGEASYNERGITDLCKALGINRDAVELSSTFAEAVVKPAPKKKAAAPKATKAKPAAKRASKAKPGKKGARR